jgi:hypothetical protein
VDLKAIYEAAYALAPSAKDLQPKRPTPTKKLKRGPVPAPPGKEKVFHNREYRTSGKVNTCSKARRLNLPPAGLPRCFFSPGWSNKGIVASFS